MRIQDLSKKELEPIAEKAGTTVEYLLQIKYRQRRPSPELASKIEEASDFQISKIDLLFPVKEQTGASAPK
jgi:hypothetical protein